MKAVCTVPATGEVTVRWNHPARTPPNEIAASDRLLYQRRWRSYWFAFGGTRTLVSQVAEPADGGAVWVVLEDEFPVTSAEVGSFVELQCTWGETSTVLARSLEVVVSHPAGNVALLEGVGTTFSAVIRRGSEVPEGRWVTHGMAFEDRYLGRFSPVVPRFQARVLEVVRLVRRYRANETVEVFIAAEGERLDLKPQETTTVINRVALVSPTSRG